MTNSPREAGLDPASAQPCKHVLPNPLPRDDLPLPRELPRGCDTVTRHVRPRLPCVLSESVLSARRSRKRALAAAARNRARRDRCDQARPRISTRPPSPRSPAAWCPRSQRPRRTGRRRRSVVCVADIRDLLDLEPCGRSVRTCPRATSFEPSRDAARPTKPAGPRRARTERRALGGRGRRIPSAFAIASQSPASHDLSVERISGPSTGRRPERAKGSTAALT